MHVLGLTIELKIEQVHLCIVLEWAIASYLLYEDVIDIFPHTQLKPISIYVLLVIFLNLHVYNTNNSYRCIYHFKVCSSSNSGVVCDIMCNVICQIITTYYLALSTNS